MLSPIPARSKYGASSFPPLGTLVVSEPGCRKEVLPYKFYIAQIDLRRKKKFGKSCNRIRSRNQGEGAFLSSASNVSKSERVKFYKT